jgi:signal transduction histidine kinase
MGSTSSTLPVNLPVRRTVSGSLAWVLAWVVIAGAVIAMGIAIGQTAISGDYRIIITHQTITQFVTIGFALVGALVASRRPRNPIGWIFLTVGTLYCLIVLAAAVIKVAPPTSPLYELAYWLGSWLWIPATLLPATFVSLLFPDGHPPSPRWRIVAWCAALGITLAAIGVMFYPDPLANLGQEQASPFAIPGAAPVLGPILTVSMVFLAVGVFGSLAALLVNFFRSADIEREQIKWLVYALGIYVVLSALTSLFAGLWPGFRWGMELSIVVTNLGILGIAIAAAIAILRHRLYDIDLIINRTLVYSALTIGVAGLYGLVVGALGVLFQAGSNGFVSLLATGLAAILVQPMRDGLQRLVNRLMYGERDDPYAVLSSLSRRLEGSFTPEATLPAVVETVAQALKLPYVAISLKMEGDFKNVASYGVEGGERMQLPLIYQGEIVGQLRLSTRSPGEVFTPAEQRLLRDIARSIGVTAHTVLLTQDLHHLAGDLQRSREELVKSREEERRRLRRDLHDGLGPQLASMKLNIEVARNLVSRDPSAAETLLVDLRSQSQAAIGDIRRLVFDLRPPALDELGLIGAIQEYIRQISGRDGLQIRLDSPKDLPPLPAAVEVAAYRIALEALANFVRHSQGSNCRVSLSSTNRQLQVEICDDGLGIPPEIEPGVGLTSMRERAAELGGTCVIEALPQRGTRVLAQIPLG